MFPGFFSFAVVRNPWGRMVSCFAMFCRSGDALRAAQIEALFRRPAREITFADFITTAHSVRNHHWEEDVRFLPPACKGAETVDCIAHFEKLATEFDPVHRRLALPAELERLNVTKHRMHQDYYDARLRDLVGAMFAEDIRRFGHVF